MWWRKRTDPVEPNRVLRCTFCNKRQADVKRLIAGPKVFICEECVEVCNDIIADDRRFTKQGVNLLRGLLMRQRRGRRQSSVRCAAMPCDQTKESTSQDAERSAPIA
jgi:ClpX C4-type zinc finger protein